ncbi:uncharacterized protein METZ01_LOCUS192708, partial [marine metagenome]
ASSLSAGRLLWVWRSIWSLCRYLRVSRSRFP